MDQRAAAPLIHPTKQGNNIDNMNVFEFATKDDAVSSTLGIVILVAITVILAAIFGAFAFGLLGQEAAPNTEFNYDFNASGEEVVVEHDGGDPLETDKLAFGSGWNNNSGSNCDFVSGEVESGDVVVDRNGNGNGNRCRHEAGSGTDLSLIWESDDGKQFIIDERSRSA